MHVIFCIVCTMFHQVKEAVGLKMRGYPSVGGYVRTNRLCACFVRVVGARVSYRLPANSTRGPWTIFCVILAPENGVIYAFLLISGCWGLGPTGVVTDGHASVYILVGRLADRYGISCLSPPLECLWFFVCLCGVGRSKWGAMGDPVYR